MRDSEVCMNNNVCAGPPTITIKDKVDDLNMTLADCLSIVNQFSKFVWGEDLEVTESIEVKSFDTAVEAALIKAKHLREWLLSATTKMGC